MKIRAVFLDFDGVILESVAVKTQAFHDLFADRQDPIPSQVVAYHLANAGVSRFEKFRHIYAEFLHEPLDDATFKNLCEKFGSLVFERVLKAEFVAGMPGFLRETLGRRDLFVVSATPLEEMREIVRKRELGIYFNEVFGSPRKKGEWVAEVLAREGYATGECVFVGDALSDMHAAIANGIAFIGRVAPGDPNIFPDEVPVAVLPDMAGLMEALDQLEKKP